MNDRHALQFSFVPLMVLGLAASNAVADAIVPKLSDSVLVTVIYEGEPLEEQDAVAALLSLASEERDPINMAVPVPQLDTSKLVDSSGKVWTYAGYLWGGENENGRFHFRGFQPVGGKPDQVRVAFYLPSQDKAFLTEILPTRPYLDRMTADLHADGTSTLSHDWPSLLQHLPFLQALGITLAVELLIVFIYCRRKKLPLARPLRVGIWANLLTLPVVWFLVIGLPVTLATPNEISVFVGIEVVAALFEGVMYTWRGKMGWKAGMSVAFIANAASALLGLVL